MHEWALAEAVVGAIINESEKEGLEEVMNVKIKIGELQQIDIEIFKFALNEIAKDQDSLLSDMRVEIEIEKAVFGCRVCGQKWAFSDMQVKGDEREAIHFLPEVAHAYIRCISCNSPDFEIVRGRGVLIEEIIGRKEGNGY